MRSVVARGGLIVVLISVWDIGYVFDGSGEMSMETLGRVCDPEPWRRCSLGPDDRSLGRM
jgi:hypothetical protein